MSDFKHKAVYGLTGQGKSWLMKRRSIKFLKRKQIVIVYSGVPDDDWPRGVKLTFDADELEYLLSLPENYGAFVFIDEGMVLYDQIAKGAKTKYPIIHTLFIKGRHKGYTVFIASQFPTLIPRRNRANCGECFCFRLGDEDAAKQVWKDYGCMQYEGQPLWKLILKLDKLQFFHIVSPDYVGKFTL